MKFSAVLFCFYGLLAGLVGGFILANSFDRSSSNSIHSISVPSAQANASAIGNENELSREEIRRAIENADARADDPNLQSQIGMALYEYAKSEGDASYLPELERILKRAEKRDSRDFALFTALGEIAFVRGQETKQSAFYENSRDYFKKALAVRPDSVQARINLASAFLFSAPPEPNRAIQHLEKAVAIEPQNEAALIGLINALLVTNRLDEAQKRFVELQRINPNNPALSDLQAQIAQKKLRG